MLEKLDMEKLQRLVYFINNVKMTAPQRERLNNLIVAGILHGEIETENFICSAPEAETSVSRFLASAEFLADGEFAGPEPVWVQSSVLYEKYDRWCAAKGLKPDTLTAFGRELKDLGLEFKKKTDGNYYQIDPEVICGMEERSAEHEA